jgi:hypothetical protein
MPQESAISSGSADEIDAAELEAQNALEGVFDRIAAELYRIASMLVGEGEESIRLVETAIANTEVSACCDPNVARTSGRRALVVGALGVLAERTKGCLAAPVRVEQMGSCIDSDDLAAAGISGEELERMISGPEHDRVRDWLNSLPTRMRAVFVLRGVAGFTAAESAELLSAHGGTNVAAWSLDAVRMVFRQGLCSLASQLLHASAAR